MIAWLWDEICFWFGGGCYRDDPEHARSMRLAWARVAQELGLRHTVGTDTFQDLIDGTVQSCQVDVTYVTNFDVQKPETIIRVQSGDTLASMPSLDRDALLRMYDESAGPNGPLIEEERAWLRGHRYGVGISGNQNELVYRQHWAMYDAADIAFICLAMVKVIRCLDLIRTKLQRR